MKRLTSVTIMIVALISLAGSTFAQSNSTEKCKNDKVWSCSAIENLKTGITSDNPGLRKSAIYFAGQYKLTELTSALVKQIKRENDRSIRILIALSLHKIGSRDGAKAISKLAESDKDLKVRRICTAIYDDIMTGSYQRELAALNRR